VLPAARIRGVRRQLLPGAHDVLLQRPMLRGHVHERHLLSARARVRSDLLSGGVALYRPGRRVVCAVSRRRGALRARSGQSGVLPAGDGMLRQWTVLRESHRPVLRLRPGAALRRHVSRM